MHLNLRCFVSRQQNPPTSFFITEIKVGMQELLGPGQYKGYSARRELCSFLLHLAT